MDGGKHPGSGGGLGTWVMGTPVAPQAHPATQQAHPATQQAATWVAVDYVPSSSLYPPPNYMNFPPAAPAVPASSSSSIHATTTTTTNPYVHVSPPSGSASSIHATITDNNPYVHVSPLSGSANKSPSEMILKLLGRCGKKLEDSTRKAGGVAGNVWHHLKTSPSVTDAALARLAQGTKVLAEGGNDKIFHQIFGIFPGEQLRKAYACYLSTSSGPVIGTLYISTMRLAFCSDNPLCRNITPGQQEWIYYKVVVQLDQLRAVNPSANTRNAAEKYIQIVTADNHEFWFMGFVSYDKALKNLTEALHHSNSYPHLQNPHT